MLRWKPSVIPFDREKRHMRPIGEIKWRGKQVFIGEPFARETVGMREMAKGTNVVRFFERDLGILDRDLHFHSFAPPRARLGFAAKTEQEHCRPSTRFNLSGINPVVQTLILEKSIIGIGNDQLIIA